jgi:hypothetical protein
MKPKLMLLTFALAVSGAAAARADQIDLNISADIRLGRRPPPPPPPVVVVVEEPAARGPAPWERAHWYQRNQGYYYYPGGDVYYRPTDHVWFYQERGEWRMARNLPEYVRVDFNRSVTLTMATDRPYIYHQQIVRRYPANYFGARVRLRDEDRRDDRRGPEKDDRGRDKPHGHDRDDRR